jgi:hypothetical protein
LVSAYTQADLDKLKRAMLRGERRVTFADGRSVEFATVAELVQQIDFVARDLANESGHRSTLAEFSKGVQ